MLLTCSGWGKSTAALGYALRASSRGLQTTIIQFLKGGAWNEPEGQVLTRLGVNWPAQTQQMTWGGEDLQRLADQAWADARKALNSEEVGLVVLDEITRAVEYGLLPGAAVAGAIRERSAQVSVIMTGRSADEHLAEVADTLTNFELTKHDQWLGKPLAP